MILEIDAGNSRLKWRIVEEEQPGLVATGNILTAGTSASGSTGLEQMTTDLHRQMKNIHRVRVSSVRGEQFKAVLVDMLQEKWALHPEFARVAKKCGGVTNSYNDVGTMGVDRWLALLAAYKTSASACCVLDCGSAITFDSVDADGNHQGGYIVPGFHLMRESLARKAPALDIVLSDSNSLDPGSSTQEAIGRGIATMVAGFAERCYQQFTGDKYVLNEAASGNPEDVNYFITGGDAELVSTYITSPHRVEKDLVLDGLAIALP